MDCDVNSHAPKVKGPAFASPSLWSTGGSPHIGLLPPGRRGPLRRVLSMLSSRRRQSSEGGLRLNQRQRSCQGHRQWHGQDARHTNPSSGACPHRSQRLPSWGWRVRHHGAAWAGAWGQQDRSHPSRRSRHPDQAERQRHRRPEAGERHPQAAACPEAAAAWERPEWARQEPSAQS